MENFASLVPLVIILPFAGALINLFLGKRMGEKAVGFVASLMAGLSFGIVLTMVVAISRFGYEPSVVNFPLIHDWINIPSAGVNFPWQLRVDTLSLTMMMVVTGIGTLIHIYAIGYMHGDARFPRFFVYLNLFLAFMLILVTGNNYLVMFVGWEGVGFCSFGLIGFWFDKPHGEGWKNSNAARKAFIVNRVGDFGFLLAIFLTFWTFGTLDYYKPGELPAKAHAEVAAESGAAAEGHNEAAPAEGAKEGEAAKPAEGEAAKPAEGAAAGEGEHEAAKGPYNGPKGVFGLAQEWLDAGNKVVPFGPYKVPMQTVITIIGLCMLLGVTGKSAQIPLFVWLPDAMAGPTPVSALIHAATMVTAGIYLIVRSNVIFHNSPAASAIVTGIGASTALMAGFVAMGQWDIKKVLAYSTVSQLGFMVAAVGLGGYVAGMFHLITHAFFKALLFLGSGSVIHGVEHGHHIAHGGHDDHGHDEHHDEHAAQAAHASHDHGHDAHDAHGHEEAVVVAEESHEPRFDPQDMRNMGGLAKKMPITYWTYLIGTLALAGIFPLSGFWSKDEILGKAFSVGITDGKPEGVYALVLLTAAAAFTAFYMWRQMNLVFYGQPRTEAAQNAPESNNFMTIPLLVLAVLAFFGGLLNLPLGVPAIVPLEGLTKWLEETVTFATGGALNLPLALFATAVALGGIGLAQLVYGKKPLVPMTAEGKDVQETSGLFAPGFALANAKLYWDQIYGALIEQPFNRMSKFLADTVDWNFWHDYVHNGVIRDGFNGLAAFLADPIDRGLIDWFFNGIGSNLQRISGRLRRTETGYIRTYAFTMLVGVLFVLLLILFPLIRQLLNR